MATLTESQAVFESKLKDMGLEGYKDAMARRGWTTLSTFAFASSWSPGSGDDTSFVNQVVVPVLGGGDHADLPKLRKLYHEAYAIHSGGGRASKQAGRDPGDRWKQNKKAASSGTQDTLDADEGDIWALADVRSVGAGSSRGGQVPLDEGRR